MEQIALARIVKTHGTQGEVKVRTFSGEVDHLLSLPEVEIRGERERFSLAIETIRTSGDALLIRFRGYDTIDRARGLVGCEMWADRSYAVPLGRDEYYVCDIVGLDLVEGEQRIGRIVAVIDGTQAPLLEVEMDGKNVLVPFMERYIGSIEIDKRRVEIRNRWVLDSG